MQKQLISFTLFLSFLFPQICFPQKKETIILWSADRRLTTDDFLKKAPKSDKSVGAITAASITVSQIEAKGVVSVLVVATFDKKQSWFRKEAAPNDKELILRHEQGHFDLAELYGRKLKKELSLLKVNKRNFKKKINKLYNKILNEYLEFQKIYDVETFHSINKEKQLEWDEEIKKELEALDEYKEPAVVVHLK